MNVDGDSLDDLEQSAREVSDSLPMRLAARTGLASYGVMHLLVAWLAVRVALGSRSERADQTGALQILAGQPLGRALLWLVMASFVAVVLWRLGEAIWGFRSLSGAERTLEKLFSAGQVVVFSVFAVLSARVASGAGGGGGGQGLTAALLRLPGGRWIVVAIGAGFVVTGVIMAYRGGKATFIDDMDLREAKPWARMLARRSGQFGYVAKAAAIVIIGVLIGLAAMTYQPQRAEGLDAALKALAAQPFGTYLLGLVGIGLASYGVFCFFDARYHRV
ncbi:MAG TPA: DUF1206 domain-containing protein [Pseudonocardia sp.]|nr:DUF1206 domain-containing protein [Pseudonocardia sp.]